LNSAFRKSTLLLALITFVAILGSCSEDTASGGGSLLIPGGSLGILPQKVVFSQPVEATSVSAGAVSRGKQERVYVGNRDKFHMRGMFSFLINSLPSNATVVSATLRLFVVSYENFSPGVPLEVGVHQLDKDFVEEEVSWERASTTEQWLNPGGDFSSGELLGSFEFNEQDFGGGSIDTIVVVLDTLAVNQLIRSGEEYFPLVLVPGVQDAWFSIVGRELAPDSPVASLLDLTYRVAGSTTNAALERRAKGDATVTSFSGTMNPSMLTVGDTPASQTFFQYDLSQLPRDATINRALLHVSVFDAAYVDTFHVAVFTSGNNDYVDYESANLSVSQGVGLDTDSLALDITVGLQRALALDSTGTQYFIGLGSNTAVNVGGYVQFYPPDWSEPNRRPVLDLIYTDAPENAKP
jgi:hypothetical protein